MADIWTSYFQVLQYIALYIFLWPVAISNVAATAVADVIFSLSVPLSLAIQHTAYVCIMLTLFIIIGFGFSFWTHVYWLPVSFVVWKFRVYAVWSGGQIISVVDIYLAFWIYKISLLCVCVCFIFIESTHIIRFEHDDGVGWCCPRWQYFFSGEKKLTLLLS